MATYLTGDPAADALLDTDLNALLIGMVLDQQVAMEKAFSGPAVIAERMGGTFDVAAIANLPEEEFVALCTLKPAIHRFPGSMGKRVHQVCRVLIDSYDGRAENVWAGARTGAEVKAALMSLPGFGAEKATIFTALLGKQRGVTPAGWRDAAGAFGEDGVFRSVADIVDQGSLQRVRETKRAVKAAKKAAAASS
ncbi:MAG: HhH-GPD-type base excision DNA repair protein [Microlunatus sp.]